MAQASTAYPAPSYRGGADQAALRHADSPEAAAIRTAESTVIPIWPRFPCLIVPAFPGRGAVGLAPSARRRAGETIGSPGGATVQGAWSVVGEDRPPPLPAPSSARSLPDEWTGELQQPAAARD